MARNRILDRLISQLINKGYSKSVAYAMATKGLQKSGNIKPGTRKPTLKGKIQGRKTPSQRAKERASKLSKNNPSAYVYNKNKNTVKLKA